MFWRRGWDSNPRWAFTHSGFRDRCTNPLCDLSKLRDAEKGVARGKYPAPVSASPCLRVFPFLPPPAKKSLHQCATLCFQYSRFDLYSMIQEICVADAKPGFNCTGPLVSSAIYETFDTSLYQGSRAHRTRLYRGVNVYAC